MKTTFFRCLILLSLFLPVKLFAQMQSVYVTRGSTAMMMNYFTPVNQTRQQWLNPYMYEDWKDGYILFGDSILWEGQLRYDMFRKEMEMVLKNDTVLVTDPLSLHSVGMGEHHFIYAYFIHERRNRQYFGADYFEVLTKPARTKLLLRRKLRIDEDQVTSGKLALNVKSDDKTHFAVERSYYIQKMDGTEARHIKLSKRSVLEALNDRRQEVALFARNNKLSFSNPSDLSQIVDFYNSLN